MKELEQLVEAEVAAFYRAEAKQAELDGLEAQIAETLVGGSEQQYTRAAQSLSQLRVEAELIQRGTVGIRSKRLVAIQAAQRLQAEQRRQDAQRRRRDSEDLQQKSLKHLRELGKLQGIEYDLSILCAQRVGNWISSPNVPGALGTELRSPFEMQPDYGVQQGRFAIPQMRQLLDQAQQLEREATEIEQRGVRSSGSVAGETFEALVAQLRADPCLVAPDLSVIAQWMRQVDEQAHEALTSTEFANAPRTYRVEFTEGRLDLRRSRLDVSLVYGEGFHQVREFAVPPSTTEQAA